VPLAMETDVVDFAHYLREPVAQESRREFHASVWLPDAGRVIRFGADRLVAAAVRGSDGTGREGDDGGQRLERFGRWTSLARFVSRRMGLHRVVSSRLFGRRVVGDCANILSPLEVPARVARFRNVANGLRGRNASELAVPAARAGEVLERLESFFRRHPGPLNNPIGLRLSAPDDFSVSPAHGRLTLWLDIFYTRNAAFETELAEIADAAGARCHWGKTLPLPAETLGERYPEWEAFRAARKRFDPDELFGNRLTDTLGLTGRGPDASGTP